MVQDRLHRVAPTSSGEANATLARTAPVAGLNTGWESTGSPSWSRPRIQWRIKLTLSFLCICLSQWPFT